MAAGGHRPVKECIDRGGEKGLGKPGNGRSQAYGAGFRRTFPVVYSQGRVRLLHPHFHVY